MNNRPVSQILLEDHGITIRPGGKGECPSCQRQHFSLKKDDTLGKCFHPSCGRFLTAGHPGRSQGLSAVLTAVYHDFHAELLALDPTQHNAHHYLRDTRGIHARVIVDAMLGAVPVGYDVVPHFQPVLNDAQAALQALGQQQRGRPTKELERAEKRVQDIQDAQGKLVQCLHSKAGWLAFFYTNAAHRPIALRLRQPYTKHFVSFKPLAAGLFGREMFTPYQDAARQPLNAFLLVTEGEFNALALQSLAMRYEEATGQRQGYVHCCAVGGVTSVDVATLQAVATSPVVCYDNDASQAGFALVEAIQKGLSVDAFTTPGTPSDLDSFISTFQPNVQAAWDAVADLIQHQRQAHCREYAGTGEEFFDTTITSPKTPAFIPKLIGDALLSRAHYRQVGEQLWIYQAGVYRPQGEARLREEGQQLLGPERKKHYLEEALDYVRVAVHQHDTEAFPDRQYINVQNGLLDWQTGELLPHTPAVFRVTQLPITYDLDASSPAFQGYLDTTFDADVHALVEEVFGWCLIPDRRFEKAVMLTGETGENGKSVLIDLLGDLLGEANVSNIALQDIEENRFRAAELYGKMANLFADLDTRALQSSSMFKTLTTGDLITAERKHQNPFTFRNQAKLIFSANKIPASRDRTPAFYRRWIIIPFTKTFNGEAGNPAPDKDLRAKLSAELPGILNRSIIGLQRLQANEAFTEPASVKDAKQSYIRQNDNVKAFLSECIQVDDTGTIPKAYFYQVYGQWCVMNGERSVTQKALKTTLADAVPKLNEWRDPQTGKWNWLGMAWGNDADDYFPGAFTGSYKSANS